MPNDNPMKYKFIAYYNDGTTFCQNDKDISVTDNNRSSFYDIDHDKLEAFSLEDKDTNSYAVNLTDGHFEINGKLFRFHDENLSGFRLIFFRRHKHTITPGEEPIHNIVFRMGWQANTKDGKNIQRVMEII